MSRRARRRTPAAPFLLPRPDVMRAAERIGDALAAAPEGLRLSELVERTGLPDLVALRGVLLLEQQGYVRWAGGRLALRGSRVEDPPRA